MYMICWSDEKVLENTWEIVSGEDDMQFRVSDLCEQGIDIDSIMVFNMQSEIK